jgi:hypothetical protein
MKGLGKTTIIEQAAVASEKALGAEEAVERARERDKTESSVSAILRSAISTRRAINGRSNSLGLNNSAFSEAQTRLA